MSKTLREQIADRYEDVRGSDLVEFINGLDQRIVQLLEFTSDIRKLELVSLYRRDDSGNYLKLPEKKLTWSEQLKRAGAVVGTSDYAVIYYDSDIGGYRADCVDYDEMTGDWDDSYSERTLTSLHRINQSTGELVKVWPK